MDSTQDTSSDFRHPDRWNSVSVPARVAKRAFENADHRSDGCWISRYSTASHGYAQIGWSLPRDERRGKAKVEMVLAHRASWVHVNGQVPLGMTIDHLCKERRCVNPAHLRLLPNYENARRIDGKDWPLGTCVNGHDHTSLVRVKRKSKSGAPRWGLMCKECQAIYQARYRAKKKVAREKGTF